MTYNGKAVQDTDTFTVVINNYRFNGGGNFIQYINEHGCNFVPNDESRVIYSTQYDMIQGEDKGQARNLLADYITEQAPSIPLSPPSGRSQTFPLRTSSRTSPRKTGSMMSFWSWPLPALSTA